MKRALIAAGVGLAGLIGFAVYDTWKHPCVRYQDQPGECGGHMHCVYHQPETHVCMVWHRTPTYPCTHRVCVERGERQ